MERSSESSNHPGLNQRTSALYASLREIASQRLAREHGRHLLQTTALLHEAYVRMASQRQDNWESESTFIAAASATMRRILVDLARMRSAAKRSGAAQQETLDDLQLQFMDASYGVLEIHDALQHLQTFAPDAARYIELMVFSEMTLNDVAIDQQVSVSTVQRRVRAARAWMRRELNQGANDAEVK